MRLRRRRRIWAELVACRVSVRSTYRILAGRLQGKDHLEP